MTNQSESTVNDLHKDVISVDKLLANQSLCIPHYQRPYKWTSKNINQLFSDISSHKKKSAYRLGTIVFHKDKNSNVKNIVDGQQRLVTLMLMLRALFQRDNSNLRKDLQDQLAKLKENLDNLNPKFTSQISKTNIFNNFQEISRIVAHSDFTEEHIDFLLNKCEVVTFTLNDVSEAFQFFDSQNARGKDLDPHDLLKAYHLREFCLEEEALKTKTVANWENSDAKDLANLFAQHLYRIKNWTKGESARYFSKNDTSLFKGVNIDTIVRYPYVEQLRIAHHFVDDYNQQFGRKIDGQTISFPYYLDQTIINGRRFFEMTSHYLLRVEAIKNIKSENMGVEKLGDSAAKIIKTINEYPTKNRTGDKYVRLMFDCSLIYYIDKFGYAEISRAIEKIFIWAYRLRLAMQVVQLASMDNYVMENNLFKKIKDAITPNDFFTQVNTPAINVNEINGRKIDEIKTLFEEMKFYA